MRRAGDQRRDFAAEGREHPPGMSTSPPWTSPTEMTVGDRRCARTRFWIRHKTVNWAGGAPPGLEPYGLRIGGRIRCHQLLRGSELAGVERA